VIPNQTSTKFIYEAEVGVKYACTLGLAASQSRIPTRLSRALSTSRCNPPVG